MCRSIATRYVCGHYAVRIVRCSHGDCATADPGWEGSRSTCHRCQPQRLDPALRMALMGTVKVLRK